MRDWRCRTIAVAMILAAAPFAGAGGVLAKSAGEGDALKRIGTLHCLGELSEEEAPPAEVNLECQLRFDEDKETDTRNYTGRMTGSGIYLVEPGATRMSFAVLALTRTAGEAQTSLDGDYDVATRHNFDIAETRKTLLFGGTGDRYALELEVPTLDGIDASTRLTLSAP